VKVVAVISQKGGVSKTTIATALAVAAGLDGKNAAVFDLDPQGSAAFWKDTRQLEAPAVISVQPVRLAHMLKAARDAGTDLVILDAPPVAKDIAFQAAEHADFILGRVDGFNQDHGASKGDDCVVALVGLFAS